MIPLERCRFFLAAPRRARRQRDERDDEGDEREGIGEKRHRRAPGRDHDARDRGPDQARAVKDRAIERDRARDFLALNELGHERGERRMFKRKGDA